MFLKNKFETLCLPELFRDNSKYYLFAKRLYFYYFLNLNLEFVIIYLVTYYENIILDINN